MLISAAHDAMTSSSAAGAEQAPAPLLYLLRSGGADSAADGAAALLRSGRRSLLLAGHVPPGSVQALLADMTPEERGSFEAAPMVLGPLDAAAAFAEEFARECGRVARPGRECESLTLAEAPPVPAGGRLCQATADDPELPTLASWYAGFAEDALGEQPPSLEESLQAVSSSAARGRLYFWRAGHEGAPVAMCSVPRQLGPDGCSLSLVFTDRAHRGAGHAEALVRAVCAEKLKTMKFVTLLADRRSKHNTTRLYERSGFVRSGPFGDMRFESGASTC